MNDNIQAVLDSYMIKKLRMAAVYIGTATNDWVVVKQRLVLSVDNEHRKMFSKRHNVTFLQNPNEYDLLVMEWWKNNVNPNIHLPEEKKHDPTWTSMNQADVINRDKPWLKTPNYLKHLSKKK